MTNYDSKKVGRQELHGPRIEEGKIDDAFAPGVVKISCGCSPERALRCLQRGRSREDDGSLYIDSPLNKQCHIFVDELDLLQMAHDVTMARFKTTREKEEWDKNVENPLRELRQALDPDDPVDLPHPKEMGPAPLYPSHSTEKTGATPIASARKRKKRSRGKR